MDYHARISQLIEAQDLIVQAYRKIKNATRGSSVEGNVDAYMLPHLKSWVKDNSGGGLSLDKIINKFEYEVYGEDSESDSD